MSYNKKELTDYLQHHIQQGKEYHIRIDGKEVEIGECSIHQDIDKNSLYNGSKYIKFNGEYIYIDHEEICEERVMNILLHRIEESSKIDIEIYEQSEEKVINKVEEINTNVLLDIIHRNTNINGIYYEIKKRISKSELYYMLKHIHPYYENSYPFKISIGTDTYEIGIGEIVKKGRYFYIEKNKVIEYLKELEYIDHEEIIIILDYLLLDTKEEIVLQLNNEYMNGEEKRLINLSDAIIDYILYSGTHLSTKE